MPRRKRKDSSSFRWKDDYIPISVRRYRDARVKRYRDRRNIFRDKACK